MAKKKKEIEEEIVEEVKDEEDTNYDIKELISDNDYVDKNKGSIFTNILLIILFFVSLGYFTVLLIDKDTSIFGLISNLLLVLFSIFFVVISMTYNRKKKGMITFSTLLLIGYFALGINNNISFIKTPMASVPDFTGKSLTDVIKWGSKNKITINQEYEYSDMISEYKIISQDIGKNTNIKDLKEITVSVSEGANPSKEIIVPSMISWDSDRVIKFIKDNYLSNVLVEFVSSDKASDTVIEQSASGSLKRDDEIKLTFSYGEELGFSEVKLADLTGMSKFEVEFYMKKNQLNYEFDYDFDKTIKKGYAKGQKIKAGDTVPVNDMVVNVTISKGPEIKVPDLVKYDMSKITEWAIKNKLKLSFSDKYDDTVKENGIISVNQETGSIVEQGSVIEVVISRGALKMPSFKTIDAFYEWANKYEIKYEEVHEFSSTVPAGEIISFSYKKGQAIKNDDTVKVTISDGVKKTVPSLKGLSKSEAVSKLDKAGLKYTFIYSSSNSVKKNYVISQSISAGSEISEGITITVTLSNGEKESTTSQRKANVQTNTNNNNNSNTGGNNNSGSSNTPAPTPTPEPTPVYEDVTVYIYDELIKNTPSATCSAIKSAYSKLNFSCSYVCGPYNGALVNSSSIDEHTFSTKDTVTLKISDNDKC